MKRRKNIKSGRGIINKLIDSLPFEIHIPKYNYCGPGTKLRERLARGDRGINSLDEACREHDIAYAKYSNLEDRHKADGILAERAKQISKSPNSGFGEKLAAWGVSKIMKAKRKLGMGLRKKKKSTKRKKKVGGFLPLIIPAIGALGGLLSAGTTIARAYSSAANDRKKLEEAIRHNKTLESIALGKKNGAGLYIKPWQGGGKKKRSKKKKKY